MAPYAPPLMIAPPQACSGSRLLLLLLLRLQGPGILWVGSFLEDEDGEEEEVEEQQEEEEQEEEGWPPASRGFERWLDFFLPVLGRQPSAP